MAYDITHKNSTVSGTPPAAGEIEVGEIAINAADAELYIKDTSGNIRKFQNTNTGTAAGVRFTQTGAGAVQRTVESKLQDVVSVKDFGAVGDGVTDDTAAIQAAIDHWVVNAGILLFPAGDYAVTSDLDADFSAANAADTRIISGYGANLVATAAVTNVLTVSVGAIPRVVRGIIIEGIRISGSATNAGLRLYGPKSSSSYLYNCTIREVHSQAVTGLEILGNTFESSVIDCHFTASATGYGIYTGYNEGEDLGGSGGTISSITIFQCTTRGGINGALVASPGGDVNIIGGTFLTAEEYAIRINNAIGGHITGAHCEANWRSNQVLTEYQAAIYIVASSHYSVRDVYSLTNYGHAVRAYVGADTAVTLTAGHHPSQLEQFHIQFVDGTGTANVIGTSSYKVVGAGAVNQLSAGGIKSAQYQLSTISGGSVASFTPSAPYGLYKFALNVGMTINAPSFTPSHGDELQFVFQQAGAGTTVVSWDAAYVVGSFVATTGYGKISTITFRYLPVIAGDKWVVVATSTT